MKKTLFTYCLLLTLVLTSCGQYGAVQKTTDYEYRYEVAKAYFVEGSYSRAASLLSDLLAVMKGTANGEESLFLLAQAEYRNGDYETSSNYFKKYYQSYPKGIYVEQARYYAAMALYKQIPDVRLDQTSTWDAINEFQTFIDYYPYSRLKENAQARITEMQDKLVEKEYLAAKLYFDLGDYMNNCAYGGSNYEACVVTAENALKDFPYASPQRREDIGILILRSKYCLAKSSVDEKRMERFRSAIDEYYSFVNDFPESKYMDEAKRMFRNAENIVKRKHINLEEED